LAYRTDQTSSHRVLAGRVAVVTGGSSGIGLAVCQSLAACGAQVVIADVKPPDRLPAGAIFQPTDVSSGEQADGLAELVARQWGSADIIVSNAGIGIHERLYEGDPQKWLRVLEVNVMGPLRIVRALLPAMLDSGEGDVVFTSSVAAGKAYSWGGVYAASKSALEAIAETLRLEVQPGVRVMTVAPGVVDTGFFRDMAVNPGNIGWGALRPEDVADVIVFAITRPRSVALNHIVVRPAGQPF
jgi:NADP-dependent 3-hydroxy acid dehydrogenase YdfG